MSTPDGVTQLLVDWSKGDQAALERHLGALAGCRDPGNLTTVGSSHDLVPDVKTRALGYNELHQRGHASVRLLLRDDHGEST